MTMPITEELAWVMGRWAASPAGTPNFRGKACLPCRCPHFGSPGVSAFGAREPYHPRIWFPADAAVSTETNVVSVGVDALASRLSPRPIACCDIAGPFFSGTARS